MPALKYRDRQPRPTDEDILESLEDSQRHGYSVRVAASNARIAKTTLVEWLQAGKREIAAFDSGEAGELGSFGQLATRYLNAASGREMVLTDAITASITDKSVAFVPALISLKARNPADWLEARQAPAQALSVTVHVTLPALPEQQLLAMVKAKLESGRKLLPPPPTDQTPPT